MFNFLKKKKTAEDAAYKQINERYKEEIIQNIEALIDGVTLWHEKTFPDATLGNQLAKLEEEMLEFRNANPYVDESAYFEEIADVLIVCGGLRRFDSIIGKKIEKDFLQEEMPFEFLNKLTIALVYKITKNKERKWKKTKEGYYRHEQ